MPLPVQLRLLRVLQEQEVRPVGASSARPVDVRVIAATHVDLDAAVDNKRFRADLFYRLNVVSVHLPPLRDRLDDVPLLAKHLMNKHSPDRNFRLTADALNALMAYHWPGNVRELENAIQHALALAQGDEIGVDVLPQRLRSTPLSVSLTPDTSVSAATAANTANVSWADNMAFNEARKLSQKSFELAYLTRLLERTQGNVSEAARVAGLDRSNFRRVLSRHEIDPNSYRSDGE